MCSSDLFHPYQYVYFGGFLAESQREDFENDYWGVSGRRTLEKIIETDSDSRVAVSTIGVRLDLAILFFPEQEAERIYLVDWNDDYSEKDYLAIGYSSKEYNLFGKSCVFRSDFQFPAYERVDLLMVDRLPIVGALQADHEPIFGDRKDIGRFRRRKGWGSDSGVDGLGPDDGMEL